MVDILGVKGAIVATYAVLELVVTSPGQASLFKYKPHARGRF